MTRTAVRPANFALIIGAMKSGTTTLFEVLGQHPEIATSSIKEPRYFSDSENWERGWDWYCGLWDWEPTSHRIALEASPAYTMAPARPGVPNRIAGIPDARFRFIYIMRHPLEQIQSTARHMLYVGEMESLDRGIPEWVIENVLYSMQIETFLEHFPRESLLLLTLEEYRRDPEASLERICRFLDVDASFEFDDPGRRYNVGTTYEVPTSMAKLIKAGPLRRAADMMLSSEMRHRVRALLPKLTFGRRATLGRFELSDAEKDRVLSRLGGDLRRLADDHGVDVERDWSIELSG